MSHTHGSAREPVRVPVRYGAGTLELELPRDRFAGLWNLERLVRERLGAGSRGDRASGEHASRAALEELRGAGIEAAIAGRRVALLVADGTRAWEPRTALEPLWPLLRAARAVQLFVCTGTHDVRSAVNRRLRDEVGAAARGSGLPVEVVLHEARSARFEDLGSTRLGTPILVNERLAECEALLVLADVKPHYFAGYSNPTKYVVPGLASLESARVNHSLALEPEALAGRHPWHPEPARRTNPLAEDLVEAFERVVGARPHFALTTVREGACLFGAWGGATREVCARTFVHVDRLLGLELEPVRFLIVSPGGAPHDESLYSAQRALELTVPAWRPGGELLFLAECPEGIGPPGAREHFFEPLARPLELVRAPARKDYALYGHKPVKLARLLERAAALWVKSALPGDLLARVHLRAVQEPQALLDDWVRRAAPGDAIAVLDDASRLWVRAARAAPGRPEAARA